MSQPAGKKYPAAFKERAVKLAVESEQSIAPTARDLGINENTLHTWIGTYHRVERQEKQVNDEHLYEELKRLRKKNARLKEERDILKKAAAHFAQQLPCSTPGGKSSMGSSPLVVYVGHWASRAVATTSAQLPTAGPGRRRSAGARPSAALFCARAWHLRHAPHQASVGAGRTAGRTSGRMRPLVRDANI